MINPDTTFNISNLEITKMSLSDLDEISDILLTEFDDFWNTNILESELKAENSNFIVAKFNNEIVGFAGIKIIVDEADIMNIVTKKVYRNHGIASILLKNLIEMSKALNLNSITLEVNEKNSIALKLYKKFGFEQIGIRANYYNHDNGIIMTHYNILS